MDTRQFAHGSDSRDGITTQAADYDLFAASFAQERLWFIDQLEPNSSAYNLYEPLLLEGHLDVAAMQRGLNAMIARHEILRTVFFNDNGQPMQALAPPRPATTRFIDISALAEEHRRSLARELTIATVNVPFDLSQGPLMRTTIIRLSPTTHVLAIDFHHIIMDLWSLGVFWRELSACYNAFVTGKQPDLAALPIQYGDYAEWQHQWLQGEALTEQLDFWRQQLDGAPPMLNLPTDHPRQTLAQYQGTQYQVEIAADLTRQLRLLSQREGATLFMTLLAAYQVLLMRYSGQDDIVVGTPVAGRTRVELEPLIGLLVNTLAIRTDLSGDPTFRQLLQRVRETSLVSLEHQDLPFEKLVSELNPERNLNVNPIFQVLFVLQNVQLLHLNLHGLTAHTILDNRADAKFDLGLGFMDASDRLFGDIEYNATLFDLCTIEQISQHYTRILQAIVAQPDLPISRIPLTTPAEMEQLFRYWQPVTTDFSRLRNVPQVFVEQAAFAPDATALVWRDEHVTFAELDRRSNQLAHYLQRLGVRGEMHVVVCLERSPDFAVALLGVLKSGGVYLPIDPTCPEDRRAFILGNAAVAVVVTQARLRENFSATTAQIVCLDADADLIAAESTTPSPLPILPDQVAYLIYTSGSTGTPKGVSVSHRALIDRIGSIRSRYELTSRDRLLQFVAMSFDVSLEEIFPTWAGGGTVIMLPEDGIPSLAAVTRLAHEQALTVLDLPPSYWHEWVADLIHSRTRIPPSLRLMVLGSESSAPGTLAIWERLAGEQATWCNVYGLTETTLIAMTYGPRDTSGWQNYTSIPIGRPLDNTRLYVLDEHLDPVSVGIPGELYIGGPALARGYLGRADLTAERFIADPFAATEPGARIYRTGDLVRTLPGGLLEFLGRVDTQVNIRGFRVELGEIETLLRAYPGVREAVVLALADGGATEATSSQTASTLVGFVVTARAATTLANRLQRYLESHLPPYMVPSQLLLLPALPRTPGGKIDRKALVALNDAAVPAGADSAADYVTPTEARLADIWATVLHREPGSRHADFFKLGGHSLQATQVVARIREAFGVEVPVRAMYDAPSIVVLSERIDGLLSAANRAELSAAMAIPSVPRDQLIPLSFAQQRLWFQDQLEPNSPLYNVPTALVMRGALAVAALAASLNALVARHESLRTTFVQAGEQPIQHIAPRLTIALPVLDLSGLPPQARQTAVTTLTAHEAQDGFDLAAGPLIRAQLIRLGKDEHLLLLMLHHTVADGWSGGIILRELSAFYTAYAQHTTPALAELPIQYADFAVWQRHWLQGDVLDQQLAYWKQQLADAPPILDLPLDHPRPGQMRYRGAERQFTLAPALVARLRELGQRESATLFMVMLAAFQTLLMRYARQDDIVVGIPISGRQHEATEQIIGLFVNTLPVRADLAGNPTFAAALRRVRESCLHAYQHQDLPFEKLVDALQLERNLSYSPVFQVLFALQDATDTAPVVFPGLSVEDIAWPSQVAKFDLSLNLHATITAAYGTLEYDTDLFDALTIERFISRYELFLAAIADDADQPVQAIGLMTDAERAQLQAWNATAAQFAADRCIHDLVTEQAFQHPAAVAVRFGDQELTYAQLNERVNQLAHYLQAQGVGSETLVGLCVERGIELVVGLLGILKAGGAYVPLDPAYPAERLAYMLSESNVKIILTQYQLLNNANGDTSPLSRYQPADWIYLDADWPMIARYPTAEPAKTVTPDNLAYAIFTSGSTGQPKGVLVPHRGLLNVAAAQREHFGLSSDDRVLQAASISFDAALSEMILAWSAGAMLCLVSRDLLLSGPDFEAYLRQVGITMAILTPQLLGTLTTQDFPALHTIAVAGERCSADLVDRWAPGRRFFNLYGPTEASIWSTVQRCEADQGRPPIGRPIANTQTYVLDAQLQVVPIGMPGELWLGGVGIARGYLHRTELTAERFVADPFSQKANARLYQTGDVVRYRPNGEIDFLGRSDQQVKIRGFRIELGEIETVLAAHPQVRECLVLARANADAEQQLVAYVITHPDGATEAGDLREYLRQHLPLYMIPAAFVLLTAFPLTTNGKVDRRALPSPHMTVAAKTYSAPSTAIEATLATIWANVLHLERVGVHDNFFELGGDSILSILVISQARQAQILITPKQFFQYQTIAALASVARVTAVAAIPQGAVSGPVPLLPIQSWFFQQDIPDRQHYNQSQLLLGPPDLDDSVLAEVFTRLLDHHDALRLRFTATSGGWQQRNAGTDEAAPSFFTSVDLTSLPDAERWPTFQAKAAALQANLDITQGPLLRVATFHFGAHLPTRILVIVHHLAIDSVSWRILLDDLTTLYQAITHGTTPQLPPKTTSYQEWSQRLTARAQTDALTTLDYWLAEPRLTITPLPVDHLIAPTMDVEAAARTVVVSLTRAETQALLHDLPKAYHTQINDALLTALAMTFRDWTGAPRLLVDLEGHGREDLFPDVDLSRTVGWFTTEYPIMLDIADVADLGVMLTTVKEALRQVPQHGIDYGLLRYLCQDRQRVAPLAQMPTAQVGFNYHGQFHQDDDGAVLFASSGEPHGADVSPRTPRTHAFDVIGNTIAGEMSFTWIYNASSHDPATVTRLAEGFIAALQALIAHCLTPTAGGYTPSDFPLAHINAQQLDKLSAILEEGE